MAKGNQEGFSEEVLFEQILKEAREEAMQVTGQAFQAEGTTCAKALR